MVGGVGGNYTQEEDTREEKEEPEEQMESKQQRQVNIFAWQLENNSNTTSMIAASPGLLVSALQTFSAFFLTPDVSFSTFCNFFSTFAHVSELTYEIFQANVNIGKATVGTCPNFNGSGGDNQKRCDDMEESLVEAVSQAKALVKKATQVCKKTLKSTISRFVSQINVSATKINITYIGIPRIPLMVGDDIRISQAVDEELNQTYKVTNVISLSQAEIKPEPNAIATCIRIGTYTGDLKATSPIDPIFNEKYSRSRSSTAKLKLSRKVTSLTSKLVGTTNVVNAMKRVTTRDIISFYTTATYLADVKVFATSVNIPVADILDMSIDELISKVIKKTLLEEATKSESISVCHALQYVGFIVPLTFTLTQLLLVRTNFLFYIIFFFTFFFFIVILLIIIG